MDIPLHSVTVEQLVALEAQGNEEARKEIIRRAEDHWWLWRGCGDVEEALQEVQDARAVESDALHRAIRKLLSLRSD